MRGITLNKRELKLKIESAEEISITHTSCFRSITTSTRESEHLERNNFSSEDLFASALCNSSLQNIYKLGNEKGINLVGTTADVTTVVEGDKSKIRRIVLDIRLSVVLDEAQLQDMRQVIDESNIFRALGSGVLFEHRIHNPEGIRQTNPGNVAA